MYNFPENLSIDSVRNAIHYINEYLGEISFYEKECDGYIAFNYVVLFDGSMPFPDENDPLVETYKLLRECRGILFSKETGKVIARRYHKFFNLNEKEETRIENIDWSVPHVKLEKLDGSMITPFVPDGSDGIRWGTKMGLTDISTQVENFVKEKNNYTSLAKYCIERGMTPIFEWCSKQNQIVIFYPDDNLILTGIRDNISGNYLSYNTQQKLADDYGIHNVQAIKSSSTTISEFISEIRSITNAEGCVLRFDNGLHLKLKGEWYSKIHATKDRIRFEKDVWHLILNEMLDDILPFMTETERNALSEFSDQMNHEIGKTVKELTEKYNEIISKVGHNRKEFAQEILYEKTLKKSLLFMMLDGKNCDEQLRKLLIKHTTSSFKIDIVRHLINGLNWNSPINNVTIED